MNAIDIEDNITSQSVAVQMSFRDRFWLSGFGLMAYPSLDKHITFTVHEGGYYSMHANH